MNNITDQPRLYGIQSTNRSHFWGKNEFNTSFPIALCCYMRDHQIKPIYVFVDTGNTLSANDKSIVVADIFGTEDCEIHFEFESIFKPFMEYTISNLPSIDVVTMDYQQNFLRPIEVKLTVIPDYTTAQEVEEKWSSELVIRPVSSAYAVMSLWHTLKVESRLDIIDKLSFLSEEVGLGIENWNSRDEIINWKPAIMDAMEQILRLLSPYQRPYLIQPIWKTQGNTPFLADRCFDVFMWSDLSIISLPFFKTKHGKKKMSRPYREVARNVRCFADLSRGGKFNYDWIYIGMSLGQQTDKAFAISGKESLEYIKHPRLLSPYFSDDILPKIILGGGQQKLKPERRLDATIYFTSQELFGG